jgi:hypothetical protein
MPASGDFTETTFLGELRATDIAPSGVGSATTPTRYVGGTASAAPASGTFAAGDYVITADGKLWICTAGGSPGTWTQAGGAGSYVLPDATTSAIGGVEIDQAPGAGHPIAVTTPRIGAASGVASLDANSHVLQQAVDDATEAATNDTLGGTSTIVNNLNRIRYQLAQLGTGAWNTLVAMVQLSPGVQQTGTINVSGEIQGSDLKAGGLTGATQASRYVGATASGAPSSGTFAIGDYVIDRTGQIWICTAAGTPGTWTAVAGSGGSVTSVALTMPAEFSVAGSPITGSGTLAVTKVNETANTLFSGPTSGGAAAPTFRPLVSADLPSAPTVAGEMTASDFKASGLSGATQASRYVGATTSGAPTSGTFAVGDYIIDQSGVTWVCTAAGTPGTWSRSLAAYVILVKTNGYTVASTDSMIVIDVSQVTITLPAANSRPAGVPLVIKNANRFWNTIAPAGTDTIDAASSYPLPAAFQSVTLVSNGSSAWWAI